MRRSIAAREWRAAIAFLVLGAVVVFAILQALSLGGGSDDGRDRTAATVAPATTTGTAGPISYQVQRGDTLSGLAARFGSTLGLILGANQLPDPDRLTEGQTIIIPPRPSVELFVIPATSRVGLPVELRVRGAKPGELVTFRVESPVSTFTPEPTAAGSDGRATATYRPELAAPPGTYIVTVTGDQGTYIQGTFQVQALTP